jgi:hypothetical protein
MALAGEDIIMNNIKNVYLKTCANVIPELRKENFPEWKVKSAIRTYVGCPSNSSNNDCKYGRGKQCQCPDNCCDYQVYDKSDWEEFMMILYDNQGSMVDDIEEISEGYGR